jgi:hypothetical protein
LDSSFGHCHQVELLSLHTGLSLVELVHQHLLDIADDNSKSLEELLEMIVMGRIPDQTSIPALIDVQKTKGSWSLRKNFPFSMNSIRGRKTIHRMN